MAVGEDFVSSASLVCTACKCLSVDVGRALCPSCLTRSLQRACKKSASLSPGTPPIGRVSPRALFPGMPRAVLNNSEGFLTTVAERCSTKAESQRVATTACEKLTINASGERADFEWPSKAISPPVTEPLKCREADSANEDRDHGHVIETVYPSRLDEDRNGTIRNAADAALPRREGGKPVIEKWHLFRSPKNLTVRTPNSASDMSDLQLPQKHLTVKVPKFGSTLPHHQHTQKVQLPQTNGQCQNARPFQKRAAPRNTRRSLPQKWTIASNADAEADLMERLLADTMPVLKPMPPLVLAPCNIKPPPSLSPPSPGDPLWKRRCIPCPKTLELHTASICVN